MLAAATALADAAGVTPPANGRHALNLMLADLGLGKLTPTQVQDCIGRGSEHLIRAALGKQMPQAPKDHIDSLYPQAWERYQNHYRRHNGQNAQVYPGVAEGLRQMKQRGWALACVTNKPTEFARTLLTAGSDNTLPLEIFGMTTNVTTPVLYALGTVTTAFSFAVIAIGGMGSLEGAALGALIVGLLAGTLSGAAMGKDVIDFNADFKTTTNTGSINWVNPSNCCSSRFSCVSAALLSKLVKVPDCSPMSIICTSKDGNSCSCWAVASFASPREVARLEPRSTA